MNVKWIGIVLISFLVLTGCTTLETSRNTVPALNVKVAPAFSSNMVLQRDIRIPVWGWATPGGRVTVSLDTHKANTIAKPDGKWKVNLPSMKAGGPFTLTVSGEKETVFSNVLVGDVWLCSGQSNMAMDMHPNTLGVYHAEQAIAAANYPKIRLLSIPAKTSFDPKEDLENLKWQECSPETLPAFSAVGYFFGRALHQQLDIPIGLINSSYGGSAAEAWTSPEALRPMPDFTKVINEFPVRLRQNADSESRYQKALADWEALLETRDAGNSDGKPIWNAHALKDDSWQEMKLPCNWENVGFPKLDGFMWFRKTIELAPAWAGKDLTLGLGAINDMDRVWFNGVEVGRFEQRGAWATPRVYTVPARLVQPDRNVIAVRVYDMGGKGGICGVASDMYLKSTSADLAPIPLAGSWRYMLGLDLLTVAGKPEPPVFVEGNSHLPTALYNSMILPILPYGIRGVIWYQGESNTERAYQYRTLFPTLIRDWRTRWGLGDLPFYFVQLASFYPREASPGESTWAELREAQTMTLSQPNTGMAVTIDIGDADNIHPRNKEDVGKRLSLWALHDVYGKPIPYSGPLYRNMQVEPGQIRLFFSHTDGGLIAKDGSLKGFAIAGTDRKFVWADARIDGNSVVVKGTGIDQPAAVRYGWANNPDCNLYNGAGLPASPFRTDSWPGMTDDNH